MSTTLTSMPENTSVLESFNTVQKIEIETALGDLEATAPTADEKAALGAAEAPSASNPFVTESVLESVSLDIHAMTAESAPADGDEVPEYDVSASAVRKVTWSNAWALFLGAVRTFTKAPRFNNSLEITPSSDLTDYTVAGFDDCFFFKITPSVDINLNSLAGGSAGRIMLIYSSVTGHTVTLKHNHSGSTLANRFSIGGDIILRDGMMALLWYDSLSSRWRCGLSNVAPLASPTFTGSINIADVSEPGTTSGLLYAVSGALKWAGKFIALWNGSVPGSAAPVKVNSSGLLTSGTIDTAEISNDAVTYAKLQNVSATDKLLGRATAGAGDVEEISLTAAGRALIDDADAAAQRTTLGLGTAAVTNTGTGSSNTILGNDSRLSDARTPTAHASSHQSGGGDAIKLDDLATPDDNTDLNASTSRHGLLRKLSGTATEYLDGNGAWSTPSGGGGGATLARATVTVTTASLANLATDNVSATIGKTAVLLAIEVDRAAWVRVYNTSANRTADASRDINDDPVAESGCLVDQYITSAAKLWLAPATHVYSGESSPSSSLSCAVQNRSGSTHTVQVIFTFLAFE